MILIIFQISISGVSFLLQHPSRSTPHLMVFPTDVVLHSYAVPFVHFYLAQYFPMALKQIYIPSCSVLLYKDSLQCFRYDFSCKKTSWYNAVVGPSPPPPLHPRLSLQLPVSHRPHIRDDYYEKY